MQVTHYDARAEAISMVARQELGVLIHFIAYTLKQTQQVVKSSLSCTAVVVALLAILRAEMICNKNIVIIIIRIILVSIEE
jgi:hypothetical protein